VFVAAAAVAATGAWLAIPAAVPFLALDAWFFAAQHGARPEQFPPFKFGASLLRLAEYQAASLFGGLPMYVDGFWRKAVGTFVGVLIAVLVLCIGTARPWRAGPAMRLVLAAAVAPPIGLLLLGAVFDNTPIELRYLSFGLPFFALLIAWVLSRARFARLMLRLTLTVQLASIAGLLLSPRTMQPARAAASEAARLAAGTTVLVPRGNDGVGIVGAFGIEAPASLPLLVISPGDAIADRLAPYHRVAVAVLAQDRDSIATLARVRSALAPPNWHPVASGSSLEIYERSEQGE